MFLYTKDADTINTLKASGAKVVNDGKSNGGVFIFDVSAVSISTFDLEDRKYVVSDALTF